MTGESKGMNDLQKKILYDLKERLIRIEDKVNYQNGRVEKLEKKTNHIDEEVSDIDKKMSKYEIWDKLKSIVITVMAAIIGWMASRLF